MGNVHYEITANNSGFIRRVQETQSAIDRTVAVAKASGLDLDGMFSRMETGLHRLAKAGAAAFTFAKAGEFAKECVNVRAQIQSLEISFETLLGNEEKANRMLSEIKEFAATTPMDMNSLAKGAQTMLSFNIEAEKVMPILKAIGDISMGDSQKFESLVLAFSQMSSTGKLMGQDLNQMINAGFNPLAEMSATCGKSISELKKEVEGGKISVDDVTAAFISATSEGGKFNNMLERQAEGLRGSFAYLRGAVSDMMNELGKSSEDTVSKSVTLAGDLVKNYKQVAESVGVLVGMYGAYKAAVMVNAALDLSTIGRLRNLARAKQTLIVLQSKLNDTMKMNPYGVAAAAVAALAYGVYKLVTYQTDYDKSLRHLEDSTKEYNTSVSKENQEIEVLFGRLKNAKKGTEEWNDARSAIWKQYGSYLSKLGDEKTALNDIAEAYNLVRKSAVDAAKARALDKYLETEDDNYAKDQAENYEKVKKIIEQKMGSSFVRIHEQEIRNIVEGRTNVNKDFLESFDYITTYSNQYGLSSSFVNNDLKAALGIAQKRRDAYDKAVSTGEDKYGIKRSELLSGKSDDDKEPTKGSREYWEKQVKDRTEAYDKILKSDKTASAKALSELKEAEKELAKYNDYKAENKNKSGLTAEQLASREENAEGKLADVIRKQKAEQIRIEQDYEYERRQNRINLMQEGEDKILAQMQLDMDREETALERRKEEEIEAELQRQMAVFDAEQNALAAGNKKYAKKVFRDSDINEEEIDKIEERYRNLFADLKEMQRDSVETRAKEAKEAMDTYLKEFGSYQEKRKAVAEEYVKKISEAGNEGERMMLTAQRNKELSDIDFDEWVDNGSIALAFGEISKLSDSTVEKLIADMEKYREKVIATFDPEKIQKYEEALAALRSKQTEESFGIFSSVVPDYFKQRHSVSDEMDSSAKNVNALYEQRAAIYNRVLSLKRKIAKAEKNGEDTSGLSAELRDAEVELSANASAAKKAQDAFSLLQEQWDTLDSPEAKFNGICSAAASSADLVGDLASQASEMADAMGAGGLSNALGTLGEAMGSVQNVASGFAQGGLIGGIAAAAGELMKWTTKLFMAGDAKHQKNIERLQEQIDALEKSYEKLGNEVDKVFSTDASGLIDQQNTLLKQQQALIRQQMAEEQAKKNADDEKLQQYREQLEEINEAIADNKEKAKEAIIGEDLKSAINEFASLYAEAWGSGKNAAEKSMAAVKNIVSSALSELLKSKIQPMATQFYDKLAEYMSDGKLEAWELRDLDAIKDKMDAIAASQQEQYEMIQERYKDLDELREELTDISFDSVRDNFKSLLSDMESTTADFTESFSDMLRNALIEGLMDSKYEKLLDEWYKEFAKAMENGELTDSERDALRQRYDAIVQQGLADRDFINDIVGGGTYSQEATRGGWETIGQDQADELNGRFTALTELEAINNSLVSEGNMIAAQILDSVRSFFALSTVTGEDNSTLRDIRDMMFLSTGHLEDISKYTKQLVTIREGIDKLNDMINQRL